MVFHFGLDKTSAQINCKHHIDIYEKSLNDKIHIISNKNLIGLIYKKTINRHQLINL